MQPWQSVLWGCPRGEFSGPAAVDKNSEYIVAAGSGGAAHGSVYFKAIDDAAFFAVNSLVEDVFVLTVNLNVYLTRPISHGEMRAVGKVVFSSKNLFVADARITDSKGREIGRGSGMFTRSKIKLNPEIGYK